MFAELELVFKFLNKELLLEGNICFLCISFFFGEISRNRRRKEKMNRGPVERQFKESKK